MSEKYVIPSENAESVSVKYDKRDYTLRFKGQDGDEEFVLLSKSTAEWLADDLEDEQDDDADVTVHEVENGFGDTIQLHVPDDVVEQIANEASGALDHADLTTGRVQEFASEDSELTEEFTTADADLDDRPVAAEATVPPENAEDIFLRFHNHEFFLRIVDENDEEVWVKLPEEGVETLRTESDDALRVKERVLEQVEKDE